MGVIRLKIFLENAAMGFGGYPYWPADWKSRAALPRPSAGNSILQQLEELRGNIVRFGGESTFIDAVVILIF